MREYIEAARISVELRGGICSNKCSRVGAVLRMQRLTLEDELPVEHRHRALGAAWSRRREFQNRREVGALGRCESGGNRDGGRGRWRR